MLCRLPCLEGGAISEAVGVATLVLAQKGFHRHCEGRTFAVRNNAL
jgi:hypothetical protein